MTKEERARATGEGLPPLIAYIDKLQGVAVRLGYLTDAMQALADDPESADLMIEMAQRARAMADDLNRGLDRTSIPELQQ